MINVNIKHIPLNFVKLGFFTSTVYFPMAESCVTAAGVPDDRRRSKYPMINVEDAIMHVLQNSNPLSIEDVDLMSSCGRVVASDVSANDPFPAFRASTMDGYAVLGDLEPGVYTVQDRIHAGDSSVKILMPQEAVYITTGAKVPEGANAVVKIEDTSAVQQIDTATTESQVNIAVKAPVGCNIRQIGCDIQAGLISYVMFMKTFITQCHRGSFLRSCFSSTANMTSP